MKARGCTQLLKFIGKVRSMPAFLKLWYQQLGVPKRTASGTIKLGAFQHLYSKLFSVGILFLLDLE
jgi:hypothetical protein